MKAGCKTCPTSLKGQGASKKKLIIILADIYQLHIIAINMNLRVSDVTVVTSI